MRYRTLILGQGQVPRCRHRCRRDGGRVWRPCSSGDFRDPGSIRRHGRRFYTVGMCLLRTGGVTRYNRRRCSRLVNRCRRGDKTHLFYSRRWSRRLGGRCRCCRLSRCCRWRTDSCRRKNLWRGCMNFPGGSLHFVRTWLRSCQRRGHRLRLAGNLLESSL